MTGWKRNRPSWTFILCIGIVVIGAGALVSGAVTLRTPDQKAYRDYARGDYESAAAQFSDPMWKGVALFKQGEFKQSALVFAGIGTAEAAFNRGNALLMQGQYTEAAASYTRALEDRPGWDDAISNREIAEGRAARLRQEGGDMTGGMLSADEIVFNTGKSSPSAGEEQTDGGEPISAAEINAVWLRQVQTKPADFLSAKFAYQYATRPAPDTEQEVAQ